MKVLHLINNLCKGGAEKLLVDCLPYYKKSEVRVAAILLNSKGSAPEYLKQLKENNIEVFVLNVESSVYNPMLIIKLKKLLSSLKPDLVHVHLFPAMYWMAFAKVGKTNLPTVFTEHSTQNRRFNNRLFRPIDKRVYRSYDKIIAISPAIADKLQSWTGLNQEIKTIRNGVELNRFKNASSYDKIKMSAEMELPSNVVILMMTARFDYPKDHKTVVNALKHLPENFVLLFVGEGKGKATVELYIKEQGLENRVRFLGFRTDIPQLMKTVDINILSSEYEGMSGVTCEGLAAGKPFLGSDVPGINDVVPDKRYLFPAGNAQALSASILSISQDTGLQEKMKEDGLLQVQQFDMDVMVTQTIQLYQEILASRVN